MASLEQMRATFDAGGIGLVLIGMPGIEKRLARYPQFYLLGRLLTQVERILEVNYLNRVTAAVIDAARESLVIGQFCERLGSPYFTSDA
jgi:DNA transposition AAA+ family ATPase